MLLLLCGSALRFSFPKRSQALSTSVSPPSTTSSLIYCLLLSRCSLNVWKGGKREGKERKEERREKERKKEEKERGKQEGGSGYALRWKKKNFCQQSRLCLCVSSLPPLPHPPTPDPSMDKGTWEFSIITLGVDPHLPSTLGRTQHFMGHTENVFLTRINSCKLLWMIQSLRSATLSRIQ